MSGEKPGDRVRLLLPMENPKTVAKYIGEYEDGMPVGVEGTVVSVDDAGTVHVRWDNGRSLGLIPGTDFWQRL